MREAEIIRPTMPAADADAPGLVERVYDRAKLPDPRDLRKALASGDKAEIRREWPRFTRKVQLEVLAEHLREQEQATEIRKGYWDPERHNYSALHPRPPQEAETARPKRQAPLMIGPEGTGRRVRVERGSIVHFTSTEGDLVHAKVTAWGARGVTAIDRDGQAWGVLWSDVREGVHPSARDEHQARLAKSEAATRDREWDEQVKLLAMDPAERARFFAERDREL